MAVRDRGNSGSGHGWTGASIVFWNAISSASSIIVDTPTGGANFGIGLVARAINLWSLYHQGGYMESIGVPVFPQSLYMAQRSHRLGRYYQECPLVTSTMSQTVMLNIDASYTGLVRQLIEKGYGRSLGVYTSGRGWDDGCVITSSSGSRREVYAVTFLVTFPTVKSTSVAAAVKSLTTTSLQDSIAAIRGSEASLFAVVNTVDVLSIVTAGDTNVEDSSSVGLFVALGIGAVALLGGGGATTYALWKQGVAELDGQASEFKEFH